MFIPNLGQPLDDIADPTVEPFLRSLQGNILKGHGRDHVAILIINFGPSDETANQPAAKAWIRAIANTRITSAHEQELQTLAFRQARLQDPATKGVATFQTLALSSRGYDFLSVRRPKDGAFRDGLRERGAKLNDPPVPQWEAPYQQDPRDIHALLLIANADPTLITAEVARVASELAAFGGRVLVEERGDQLKDAANEGIEHFGYRDGVSQPLLIRDPKAPHDPEFDQHAPLKLVLTEDRAGPERFGSYLVYRKLEQNPKGFETGIAAVVSTGGVKMDKVLVGAMAIGRFKDGTPVVVSKSPMGPSGDEKDFDYSEDKHATKCPFHAHIRKVNPRGEIPFFVNLFAREQKRRIARRGITYGARADLSPGGGQVPEWGVGLLFMCYQNDISDQFEFIQKTWANNPDFRKSNTGLDPVIGQSEHPAPEPNEFPNWPLEWGSANRQKVQLGGVTRLRGGEYFFAPSMETLQTFGEV